MKKLLAALTIAGIATVAGPALAAHAAPQDQPWGPGADGLVHLSDGSCYQPMSNPPAHVPCTSTRATTPYVEGQRFPDDPVSTAPPDTLVPEARTEPAVPRTRKATPKPHPVVVVIVADPISLAFEYWVGV
jgi:hypothetical protein